MPSRSDWRAGHDGPVELGSPDLLRRQRETKVSANVGKSKGTYWRLGDDGCAPLGSEALQSRSLNRRNPGGRRCRRTSAWRENGGGGARSALVVGSSALDDCVFAYRAQLDAEPRLAARRAKQQARDRGRRNLTCTVVGSPTLVARVADRRRSSPSPTHGRAASGSPIIPLGSKNLQNVSFSAAVQAAASPALGHSFSNSFIASTHASVSPAKRMTWNDRMNLNETTNPVPHRAGWLDSSGRRRPPNEHAAQEEALRRSPTLSRNVAVNINSHSQTAPAPLSSPLLLSSSLSWSTNANRRAESFLATGKSGGDWRYSRKFFFHQAGRQMVRNALS